MYNPSIWSDELAQGRRDYIVAILQGQKEPVHLDELALILDRVTHENNPDLWLSTTENFHNSVFRRILTRDLDFINRSAIYHCVIISTNLGVKIANKAECEKMIENERKEAVKKLAKIFVVARKYNLDAQLAITGEEIQMFPEAV